MSCKSGIYCVNLTSGTSIPIGGTYAPTNVVRRYGNSIHMNPTGISLLSSGYYDVNVTAIVEGLTAETPVTATLYQDGVAVPGAVATQTIVAANDETTLNLSAIVRVMCRESSTLSVIITGQAVESVNLTIEAVKL